MNTVNSLYDAEKRQPLRFVPPRRAQLFCPAPFTPGTAELCSGRRPAIHSPSAVCTQQATTYSCKDSAALRAAVAPAPRARLHAVCRGTFQAAEAALRQQPAASACRWWAHSSVRSREGIEGIARVASRAAATDAIHRAALCADVSPGRFAPGTDELCSGRRLASLHVCYARLISHGAACIPPDRI